MKLYVYCVSEAIDEAKILHGIGGVPVRQLKNGNLSVFVSALAGDAVTVNRENAVAHAAVIQNVLRHTTPLPFQFRTVVSEAQLDSYLTARREALESKLELVRDCVEMSVKIISGRDATKESPRDEAAEDKPGTTFLTQKRREILGSEARAAEAKRVAAWLEAGVGEVVQETEINLNPTSRLILAAAHLVKRERVAEYRTKLNEARRERPELHFLISGPWAPYSFANIDLEFKTHFGVS